LIRGLAGRPEDEILDALHGTAYFLRRLSLMREEDYDGVGDQGAPLSRRRTIAAIGYHARGLARLAEESRVGNPVPRTFDSADEREEAVELGSTLPQRALRFLVEHSAVHLSVEWRDLPAAAWHRQGQDADGTVLTPAESVWRRTRSVWLAAVDLGNGGSFVDFPSTVLTRMIAERAEQLTRSGTPTMVRQGAVHRGAVHRGAVRAAGSPADLARWLFDRGDRNLAISPADPPGVGIRP
jgi:maleylpyruvate isomerase